MACAACGKQLTSTTASHQNWQRCSRCKQAFYCDAGCQRVHWKRGGHKQACKEPMACNICLDNDGPPLPIQCGCGCREEAGCTHVACRIKAAEHQGLGYHEGWHTCTTCKQRYTGAVNLGLAEALWERHRRRPVHNADRLAAQGNLASAYVAQGRFVEAERRFRNLFTTQRRLFGADCEPTIVMALNLGMVLRNQDKNIEAVAVFRDVLPRAQRVLGPEHAYALTAASGLASTLTNLGNKIEAEPLLRDTLAIQQRVLGYGDHDTLETGRALSVLLINTRRYTEAEELSRVALAQAKRTLGPEHPLTLTVANVLALVLSRQQGKAVEAEALLKDTLAMQLRVRGPDHPDTQDFAQSLQDHEELQRRIASRGDET